MKKKMITLSLVLALAATAIIGGTLAYFTDNEEVTNTFTVGNVDIELTETEWKAPATAVPGDTYAKNPVVNNIGKNDAWVRVDVTISDAAAFTAAAADKNVTDLATIFKNHDESKWTRADITADTTNDTLTYSYYYKTVVTAGTGTTDAIFTAVEIPNAFDNSDMEEIGDFTITIEAHAIQVSEDFATPEAAFANYVAEKNQ